MGLDMYLSRRVYVGNWDHDPEGQKLAAGIMDALGLPTDGRERYQNAGFYVEIPEAYWRKANAIHGWFVRNVQDGSDDCGHYEVSREQLQELRDLCQDILSGKRPKDDLPPTAGFFFGNTDNDEYYREDLAHTVEMLDKVLAAKPLGKYGDDFQYHSSW